MLNPLFFVILDINLIHQVSDKRLLKSCGNEKGYLIETSFVSVRPPGLHNNRAEVWTK